MAELYAQGSHFAGSWDNIPKRFRTPWATLIERLCVHTLGQKDGPAIACALFATGATRSNDTITHRTMVALDIETNKSTGEIPAPIETLANEIRAHRRAAILWTTFNHRNFMPRYRVLVPITAPIPYESAYDPYISAAVAAQLRVVGVCDQSKYGAASLFFLPRKAPEHDQHSTHCFQGNPFDSDALMTAALTMADAVGRDEAQRAAERAKNSLHPEIAALIEAYNSDHPLRDQFARYGYQRQGNRWRSRYQHGIGATTVLPDGLTWASFSESDALAGVGHRPIKASSQCACWGDAFSLFVHYEHRNSFRDALAHAKAGYPHGVPAPHNSSRTESTNA